jgi:hypothetical protein
MPEIARRVLEFIVDREDELNLFSSYELLLCRCGSEVDEGLDYLLERQLIDFDEQYFTYYATKKGECALKKAVA